MESIFNKFSKKEPIKRPSNYENLLKDFCGNTSEQTIFTKIKHISQNPQKKDAINQLREFRDALLTAEKQDLRSDPNSKKIVTLINKTIDNLTQCQLFPNLPMELKEHVLSFCDVATVQKVNIVSRNFLGSINSLRISAQIRLFTENLKNATTSHQIISLLESAAQNPFFNQITSINLNATYLSPNNLNIIIHLLPKELEHLKLNNIRFTEDGINILAQGLTNFTNLQHLDLSDNNLGPEGAKILAPALTTLTHLQHLDLSLNRIGPDGAQILAPALTTLTHLQHLDLRDNNLGPEGAKVLAPALTTLTHLQHLDLRDNNLGSAEAKAITPLLKTIKSLRRLGISDNNFSLLYTD